jgi:hypothetical protein
MGLGTERGEWDLFEWFDLRIDVPDSDATMASLERAGIWQSGPSTRVLLVDLDNVRVSSELLRGRVSLAVVLARQADVAAFAGQHSSVERARPALAEYGASAMSVGDGPNAADLVLLDAADIADADIQFVVISNDGIFARLAMRGPLVVLSPGVGALSDRLAEAAERVIDLQAIEVAAGFEKSAAVARA